MGHSHLQRTGGSLLGCVEGEGRFSGSKIYSIWGVISRSIMDLPHIENDTEAPHVYCTGVGHVVDHLGSCSTQLLIYSLLSPWLRIKMDTISFF